MAGTTSFPGAFDDFSAQSPGYLDDVDSKGRDHDQRHDDVEAAIEAMQTAMGTNPPRTLLLADGASVPGGTPSGTFIVRYSTA